MTEIEVKILEINPEEVTKKLLEMGAKKTFEGNLLAYHFDFADQTIHKSKNTMRLRKEGDKVMLTFKRSIQSDKAKIRDETEVEVSDFDKTLKILLNLGLHSENIISKKRVVYSLDDAHFAFDKLTGEHANVPEYLEIETEDVDTLYSYVMKLGFQNEECKIWTQEDVIKFYESKRI